MNYMRNNAMLNSSEDNIADMLPEEGNDQREEFSDSLSLFDGDQPPNMNWEEEYQVTSTTDDILLPVMDYDANNEIIDDEQGQDKLYEAGQAQFYVADQGGGQYYVAEQAQGGFYDAEQRQRGQYVAEQGQGEFYVGMQLPFMAAMQQEFQIPNYEFPSFFVNRTIEQLPFGQLFSLLDQACVVVQEGQPLDVVAQSLYIATDAVLHPQVGVLHIMPAMGEYRGAENWTVSEYLRILEEDSGILTTATVEQALMPDFYEDVAEGNKESIRNMEEQKPQMTRIIKCKNCFLSFESINFAMHMCYYDSDHNLINANEAKERFGELVVKRPFSANSHAQRLLAENQIRIRRFFKETLRFDLEAYYRNDKNDAPAEGKVKKSVRTHQCTVCERKFVHASGLSRHMEKHTLDLLPQAPQANGAPKRSALLQCGQCGIIECSAEAMGKHVKTHFEEIGNEDNPPVLDGESEKYLDDAVEFIEKEAHPYKKNGLYEEFFGAQPLEELMQTIITKTVLQCEFCDTLFANTSFLVQHVQTHTAERRFECRACNIFMNTSKEATNHFQAECVNMREQKKLKNVRFEHHFACTMCYVKFSSLELLLDHRYTSGHLFARWNPCYEQFELPCEYCPALFVTADDAIAHYDENHRKNARSKEKTDPSKKSRKFLCDVCGKSYTQSSHLWQHLRFHQGVKPFECTEPNCGAKFTIRPDLNDHIRKCHTFERPFKCQICGKTFLTGSVYYQHRLIHRGERRYECDTCHKRFYRADALKNHLRIHTGERPFSCELCTKSFRQRGDRDKHMRARHAMLDEATREMLRARKRELEKKEAKEKKLLQKVLQVSGVLPFQALDSGPSNAPLIGPAIVQNILAMSQVNPLDGVVNTQHPIDF